MQRRKTPYNKIKDWTHLSKVQGQQRAPVNTAQRKNESKQSIKYMQSIKYLHTHPMWESQMLWLDIKSQVTAH